MHRHFPTRLRWPEPKWAPIRQLWPILHLVVPPDFFSFTPSSITVYTPIATRSIGRAGPGFQTCPSPICAPLRMRNLGHIGPLERRSKGRSVPRRSPRPRIARHRAPITAPMVDPNTPPGDWQKPGSRADAAARAARAYTRRRTLRPAAARWAAAPSSIHGHMAHRRTGRGRPGLAGAAPRGPGGPAALVPARRVAPEPARRTKTGVGRIATRTSTVASETRPGKQRFHDRLRTAPGAAGRRWQSGPDGGFLTA